MADVTQINAEGAQQGTPQVPTLGLLRVKSNEILDQEAKLKADSAKLLNDSNINNELANLIETRFNKAVSAKDYQTDIHMDSLRRRNGEYSSEHLAEIKRQGGSEIYMKLTEIRCNAAEAMISDVVIPSEGKPWQLKPTPKPELPQQVVEAVISDTLREFEEVAGQVAEEDIREMAGTLRDEQWRKIREEAKRRSARMENLIDDEFTEGGLLDALEEGIADMVTYGTMIIKGPYIQMEKSLEWLDDNDWKPDVTVLPLMKFKAVDPMNFFPSPGASTVDDATYLTERDTFSRHSLSSMRGVESYNTDLINKLLGDNKSGTNVFLKTDAEKANLENRQSSKYQNPDDQYEGIWYSGQCEGWILKDWGITDLDANETYEIVALKVGQYVIHARLNPDPLGKRLYTKAVYKPVKGSFWGSGVPRLMTDAQDSCNATARALINNLAIGSGPQVVISNIENMAEGEDITSMYPWKIWQSNTPSSASGTRKPIDFYQPNIYTDQLMRVFEFFMKHADDETGIPRFDTGASGIPKTSSGLAMLMNSSSRVLKKTITNIDRHVIRPMIERAFVWNMLYVDDPSIKGDVQIEASGAMGMFIKEQQQLRLNEYMALTANADDRALLGKKGRATLLRAGAKDLPVATDKVVLSDSELEEMMQKEMAQVAPPPQGAPPGGPLAVQGLSVGGGAA